MDSSIISANRIEQGFLGWSSATWQEEGMVSQTGLPFASSSF